MLTALFVTGLMTRLDLLRQSVVLIKRTHFGHCQAALQTPIRVQRRRLLAEIDGPTRRPLLLLTLMRCVLSGITAFKGADGRAAECVPVESALVLNVDLNE